MKRFTLFILPFFIAIAANAQFENLNGPGGGIIWKIFESSENYFFALTDNSGIYRSSDNLQSWHPTSLLNQNYEMAQTPDGGLYAVNNSGLFVSNDHGLNFERVTGADQLWLPKYIEAINDSVLVILSSNPSGRIFRSTNFGASWETVFDFNSYFYFNCLTKSANGYLFAMAKGTFPDQNYSRVLRSIDDGATWQELDYGDPVEYQMNCMSDSDNNLFLESTDNIYKSTNNGDSWSILTTPFSLTDLMWKNSNDNIHVIDMDGNHYYSSNAGVTWTSQNFSSPDYTEILFYYSDNDTIIALSEGNGIYRSYDFGQNWELKCNGLTATNIDQLAVNSQGIILAGDIYSKTIFRTDSEGLWHQYDLNFEPKRVFCCTEGHFYCSDINYGIYRSTDNAQSWDELTLPENILQPDLTDVKRFSGDLILAVNNYHYSLLKTSDEGDNWEEVPGISPVQYMDVDPNNGLYVSNDRVLCKYHDVGINWDTLFTADEIEGGLWQFAIDPSTGDIVITDRQLGVQYSPDGGQTWSDRNDQNWLPSSWYWFKSNTLEVDADGNIYMTAEIDYDFAPWHIYITVKSSDGGITWENAGEGLPLDHAASFHVGLDENLYAGTLHGVYKRDLNSGISNQQELIAASSTPITAYPNPFNSTVRISLNVEQAGNFEGKIFDILGREVYSFANQNLSSGNQNFLWRGVNNSGDILPNGIYFIRLRTSNNKTISHKIVLLK